jgi:chemotaxis signal transduction protein
MTQTGSRFLIAMVEGKPYAFQLSDISEVTETFRTFPFPKSPPCYLGLINSHGAPIPLIDFAARILGSPPRQSGTILVLDHKIASLAIRVDNIERIASDVRIMDAEDGGDGPCDRILLSGHDKIPLPNLDRLVAKLEDELLREHAGGKQRRTR